VATRPKSRRAFEVSLALALEIGRPDLVAKGQASLAISGVVEAEPRAALELFDDALRYFRDVDDRFHIGDVLAGIGQAHRLLAEHQDARIAYLEALRLFTDARNLPSIGMTLAEMAALESSAGRHAEALRLTGAAAALAETTGASAPIPTMRLGDVETAARQAMGDAAVEQALAEGRRMTLEEAVEYAGSLADST
jgi:tetratricopeptide (TPR) repeat protein